MRTKPKNTQRPNENDENCSKNVKDEEKWLVEINLENTYLVTAVETQGRYGNGTGREFVSEYMIDYHRPGSKWIRYRNRTGHTLMTGNDETTQAVLRVLDPPLVASRLRIVPHSRQTRTICLRAELHGCIHKDGLLYYSTLPGGSRVGDADFRDPTFENSDLYTETGIKRGLGLLSDGYVSDNSPFDEMNPNGSWIGWSKHHTGEFNDNGSSGGASAHEEEIKLLGCNSNPCKSIVVELYKVTKELNYAATIRMPRWH
ncbi:f5/8 type C domain protein [Necator americanus]|uniref:F5/8 type C domain protein n=1 Tax=Necator americanus TaxID=51031 RepID=W2TU36_NECAM|nr:f5/8 type C domain protein [Necator americanus]ETN85159.1 f5/8 type C domain protein [Necator americanus]